MLSILDKSKNVDDVKVEVQIIERKKDKKLYQTCSNGKVEEVQKLLQNSQINMNGQNQDDYLHTPFYVACVYGCTEIVKLLLNDNRVDFNKADNTGWTPFHIACGNEHIEIVKLLLNDNRVDVNKAKEDGKTPFYIACLNERTEIVKLLLNDERVDLNKGDGSTPFLIACYSGKTEVVKYLLESGKEIDINQKDKYGKTGLDYAKQKGNTDLVKLIQSFQKNPNETREKLKKELAICKCSFLKLFLIISFELNFSIFWHIS